jgi:diguanylate cyclase (GGDEF)-like protein
MDLEAVLGDTRHESVENADSRTPPPPSLERRRGFALAAMWAIPALLVVAGAWQAWPLFVLPLVFAIPLSGTRGMAVCGAATALVLALLTGNGHVAGTELVVGFAAFCAAGIISGLAQQAGARRLQHVEQHSVTDRLTGLPNYAYFADALVRECRRADRYGHPLSMVLIDLDKFKPFNDKYGHEAGNRMLAEVGKAIQASLRSSDLAARYGGEELVMIVQGHVSEAVEVADRVRASVARIKVPVPGGGRAGTTLSAGVAEYVPGTGLGDLMLDQADKALYAAKDGGRNQVRTFEPEHRWARVS